MHVALQDGFKNDTVRILVNSRVVYDGADVTTDLRISLAAEVDVPVAEGKTTVEVEVPTRKLKGSVEVDPAATPHVGVRIQAGKIEFSKSREMFRYM